MKKEPFQQKNKTDLSTSNKLIKNIDLRHHDRIGMYLERKRKSLKIEETTQLKSGQILDWIPCDSQCIDGKIATPPPLKKIKRVRRKKISRLTEFELEKNLKKLGPKGCVPILRRDVNLLELPEKLSLSNFLSKHGKPTFLRKFGEGPELEFPMDSSDHWYASSTQTVTNYGGEGYISAWAPYVEWSDEFSLGQIALVRGATASRQTLEAGWQTYNQLYGDWKPHLFIFYTTNGYTESGDNIGGYNRDVDGWIQVSDRIFPGALSSPVSNINGEQYDMFVKYQFFEGNWWLRINNQWIGYYPASLFNHTGLRTRASQIYFYGETIDSNNHSGMTRTDMGSGRWPYEGWKKSAYMRNLKYQSTPEGNLENYNPGWIYENDRECYDIEGKFNNKGNWDSYFWWGGSGKNSKCG